VLAGLFYSIVAVSGSKWMALQLTSHATSEFISSLHQSTCSSFFNFQVAFTGEDRWLLQMRGKPLGGLLPKACPQFCVELASSKETLEEARAKAKEYLVAG
jgi:hypothetical protein